MNVDTVISIMEDNKDFKREFDYKTDFIFRLSSDIVFLKRVARARPKSVKKRYEDIIETLRLCKENELEQKEMVKNIWKELRNE